MGEQFQDDTVDMVGKTFAKLVRRAGRMSANVERLVAVLAELDGIEGVYIEQEGGDLRHVAECLAAHGVLALDAVTDDDIMDIAVATDAYDVSPGGFRAALRRLATGGTE